MSEYVSLFVKSTLGAPKSLALIVAMKCYLMLIISFR